MKIGDREIGPGHPPYIIAELGVNHDGQIDRALRLCSAAAEAGADAVKIQLFKTEQLLSSAARLAAYQSAQGETDPIAMLQRLELDLDEARAVVDHAHEHGVHAIATVFSLEMVDDARSLGVDAFKLASPDLVNRPLIEALRTTDRPLILSSGAATMDEVHAALTWVGDHPHATMQCVSAYPTPDDCAALGGIAALADECGGVVGYSDHTTNVDTGALAVAAGATMLEKHFTYDKSAKGPDHAASLEPVSFAEYAKRARHAAFMRGETRKFVQDIERDVHQASRQSIVARHDLPVGHTLQTEDLTIKRPGTGVPASELDSIIGRTLSKPAEADMPLTPEHLA